MNKNWKWFLPGYLLALPGTIVGLVLLVTWYFPESVKFRDGCIEVIPRRLLIGGPWVGGQTFGNVIFLRDEHMQKLERLHVHERVHVWQAMVLSWPVFITLYLAHFLVLLITTDGDWVDAYREIWAERKAYAVDANYSKDAWGVL